MAAHRSNLIGLAPYSISAAREHLTLFPLLGPDPPSRRTRVTALTARSFDATFSAIRAVLDRVLARCPRRLVRAGYGLSAELGARGL
jgi:hypothetical protein